MLSQEDNSQSQPDPEGLGRAPGISELGMDLSDVLTAFAGLALLETKLAFKSVPNYIAASITKLLMLMCVWLSLSVCLMWAVRLLSDSVFVGILAMTGLQIAGYVGCRYMQSKHRRRLSLPNTRHELNQLGNAIHETIKQYTTAEK